MLDIQAIRPSSAVKQSSRRNRRRRVGEEEEEPASCLADLPEDSSPEQYNQLSMSVTSTVRRRGAQRGYSSKTSTSRDALSMIPLLRSGRKVPREKFQCLLIGVCAFVTMHFFWTVGLFMALSFHDGSTGSRQVVGPPKALAFFVEPSDSRMDGQRRKAHRALEVHLPPSDGAPELAPHAALRRGSIGPDDVVAEGGDASDINKIFYQQKSSLAVSFPTTPLSKEIHFYDQVTSIWKSHHPDFGSVKIRFYLKDFHGGNPSTRTIKESYHEPNTAADDDKVAEQEGEDDEESESYDNYYAFDDDYQRTKGLASSKFYQDERCRRVQEHRYTFPNCNEFHQVDRTVFARENHFKYINNGAFREVFSLETSMEKFAIKEILFEEIGDGETADHEFLEYVRMDALVAERLSASPRTYDIYGHCGLSIASEFFYHGDVEDLVLGEIGYEEPTNGSGDEVQTRNGLSPVQKLVLALDMAEGLADLHGYSSNLIIHDDVQLSQFLLNKDRTRLKLNDFNRAEFPLWNGHNYCMYQNGKGHGTSMTCISCH